MTGFIFDVIGAAEAQKFVKNKVKLEGKMRRVLVLRTVESGNQKPATPKKVLVQKTKEEGKKGEQQLT